jgi:hypothetical protein
VRSRHRRLAKLIHADGQIQDYDLARTFDMSMVQVSDLDHLFYRLDCLASRSDLAIVRGAIIGPPRIHRVRRLIHDHDEEPDGNATLQDASHRWVCLDIDGIHRPDDVAVTDLLACAHCAIDLLPGEFRPARAIVQATSGHGLKPGSRLRLWYWSSRPLTGPELSRWLRRAPVDDRLFSPCQVIYTAQPTFAPGLADHIPCRMAERPGTETVAAPSSEELAPPPPPKSIPRPERGAEPARRYAFGALRRAVEQVAAAPEGSRNTTLNKSAWNLMRFVAEGTLATTEIADALAHAAIAAGLNAVETEQTLASALAAGARK